MSMSCILFCCCVFFYIVRYALEALTRTAQYKKKTQQQNKIQDIDIILYHSTKASTISKKESTATETIENGKGQGKLETVDSRTAHDRIRDTAAEGGSSQHKKQCKNSIAQNQRQ